VLKESQGGVKFCPPLGAGTNRFSMKARGLAVSMLLSTAALLLIAGCATKAVPPTVLDTMEAHNAYHDSHLTVASDEAIQEFSEGLQGRYTLAPGDKVDVTVWARPELSGQHVVGPDGDIQVPFLGSFHIAGLTADEASTKLSSALSEYYLSAYATITISSYAGNTVTVLGHVAKPGQLAFTDNPTLLEVLAKADTRQATDGNATQIWRCAIFRGSDRALWLDLGPLYRGDDLDLNVKLRRGDLVYVPDPSDQLVYVMGQVNKPGAYQFTPNMSFLDALAQAGGPNDAAQPSKIVLARPRQNQQQVIDLKAFLGGNGDRNYALQEGDIIYVPKSGIAKVGYVLQQLNPVTSTLLFGAALF